MPRDRVRLGLGLTIIAALLTASGANALRQVFNEISDPEPRSLMLGVLQFTAATVSLLAVIAIIRRDTRAQYVIAAWGCISAAMVVLLEPLGFVEAVGRAGLWQGAAAILAMAAVMIWYVRRSITSPSATQ